jgi:hypothetical protein
MTNHARLSFSVPKPPSKQSTRDNPDETLTWLNLRLRELVTAFEHNPDADPVLDVGTYMVIYSTTHQYTTSTKDHSGVPPAERLYKSLEDIIRSHCRDLRIEILQSHSEATDQDVAILEAYAREWKRHGQLAKLMAHNYRYVERHWIRQEMDRPKSDVYVIKDLHSLIWSEEVMIGSSQSCQPSDATKDDFEAILDIAVRLREREGFASGQTLGPQASDLLREVFGSFDEVGVRIGMLHATEEHRMVRPKILAKHETLRSGLKITVWVPKTL